MCIIYSLTLSPPLRCSCAVALGDLQSEEERDIVLELCLPPVPATNLDAQTPAPDAQTPAPDDQTPAPDTQTPAPDRVLAVSLSYFNVITSALDSVSCELCLQRTGTCAHDGTLLLYIVYWKINTRGKDLSEFPVRKRLQALLAAMLYMLKDCI